MTEPIHIYVPGLPVAQPRTRRSAQGGVYTPTKASAFKATVALAARDAYPGPPLLGPLRVDIMFVFPRRKGDIWKKKAMPRIPHAAKPDRDNLDKAVLDALKGLVWRDDAQVQDGRLTKWYAAGHEQPHVEITIAEVVA